jgi:MEMO1 family protein
VKLAAAPVALAVGLLASTGSATGPRAELRAEPGRTHAATFFDSRSFNLSHLRAPALQPAGGAKGVIVPHHWLAGHLIVAGLRDLGWGRHLRRVVLIAPNHIGAGGGLVTTSDRSWETPFGRVEPDGEAVRALAGAGLVTVAPAWLTHEHAIDGLMPALASELPETRVVPLAIHSGLRRSEVQALARALSRLADDGTAFVASVDFSHYLAPEVARLRDGETLAALNALDSEAILGFSNDHLDSPGSIATLMETMRLLGAERFELRANTNSAELNGRAPGGVTSYVYGFYR